MGFASTGGVRETVIWEVSSGPADSSHKGLPFRGRLKRLGDAARSLSKTQMVASGRLEVKTGTTSELGEIPPGQV